MYKKKIILFIVVFFSLSRLDSFGSTNRMLCLDGHNNRVTFGLGIMQGGWTMEVWFKGNDTVWKETEVLIGGGEYSSFAGVDNQPLVIKNGKLHNERANLWSDVIIDDQWHHAALSCDGKITTLFLDGKIVDSAIFASPILVGSIGMLETEDSAFCGYVDEVRIWDTSLPRHVIAKWRNKSIDRQHQFFHNLKVYFPFDEELEESTVNWVGKGQQAYHIRNGRIDYKNQTPLAYTIESNNPYWQENKKKKEFFNAVVVDSEWDVDKGAVGDAILKLRIIITGNQGAIHMNGLKLDLTSCSNLSDIKALNLYYNGKKARSLTKQSIYAKDIPPQLHINLEGEDIELTEGVNYILLTADISDMASLKNKIKIKIPSITIDKHKFIPQYSTDLTLKTITESSENSNDIVRLLSWNIWHGGRHLGNVGVGRVIELIKKTNADIITMQEAYGSQDTIADALKFNLQTHSSSDNLALFSRYPIQEVPSTATFSSNPSIITLPNDRKILVNSCWLRYANDPEYTASFPKKGQNTKLWVTQDSILAMKDVASIINNDIKPYLTDGMSVIIAGDFNSFSHLDWTERAAFLHYGYGKVDFPVSNFMLQNGFIDSFREVNKDEVARPEGTFAVIYGHLQTSRIDFIYYSPLGIDPISSKIIRTAPEIDDVWPSDHAAVITTFKIR